MSSSVLWNTTSKAILYSEISKSNLDHKVAVCKLMNFNPDDCTIELIDGEYTSKQAKQYLYVTETDELTERPEMLISVDTCDIDANSTDKATLSGCPEGAEVYQDNELLGLVTVDGLVEITASVPKDINIKLVLWPWLNWTGVIYAT